GSGIRTDAFPYWEFGTPFGARVSVKDIVLEAAFADRGLSLADVRLHATIDLRDLSHMADGGWEQICRNRDERGPGCTACQDGEAACLRLKLESIAGPRIDGTARE
ncbi:MAG: hypothetical protein AAFN78_20475, partial [Pseudomonadota bacterium]